MLALCSGAQRTWRHYGIRHSFRIRSMDGGTTQQVPLSAGENLEQPVVDVADNLNTVRELVRQAAERGGSSAIPRLVAVSKTQPREKVLAAHEAETAGHRVFGENYVQELLAKAPDLPDDIQWHFIGNLQTNKAKSILSIHNLYFVETVDREKLAAILDRSCEQIGRRLNIMLQVNTSGEESKSGIDPEGVVALAKYVKGQCTRLDIKGLMTIGMPDYSPRPKCFTILKDCRRAVAAELDLNEEDLELSMGMSGDFEQAIEMGSTNVRVGSKIFGPRVKKAA